jgi:hypothetical protein
MDIALLCTEYANLYEIQISFKGKQTFKYLLPPSPQTLLALLPFLLSTLFEASALPSLTTIYSVIGALYSVKLRLEFAILNQLIAIASGELGRAASGGSLRPSSHSRLPTHPAPNTWVAHLGTQELHLKGFDATVPLGRHGNTAISVHTDPHANANTRYTAAVGASRKPHRGDVEEGCVIKTTEVQVRRSSLSVDTDEDEEPAITELQEARLRY